PVCSGRGRPYRKPADAVLDDQDLGRGILEEASRTCGRTGTARTGRSPRTEGDALRTCRRPGGDHDADRHRRTAGIRAGVAHGDAVARPDGIHQCGARGGELAMFLLNLLLALAWMALTGTIDALAFAEGFVLGYIAIRISRSDDRGTNYAATIRRSVEFILFFLWELLKANLRVMY